MKKKNIKIDDQKNNKILTNNIINKGKIVLNSDINNNINNQNDANLLNCCNS